MHCNKFLKLIFLNNVSSLYEISEKVAIHSIVLIIFQGDSGGPLHCNMKDGRWYLAGLTSFGSGCAKPGYPDVFMRLTSYTKWIEETIRNHDRQYQHYLF